MKNLFILGILVLSSCTVFDHNLTAVEFKRNLDSDSSQVIKKGDRVKVYYQSSYIPFAGSIRKFTGRLVDYDSTRIQINIEHR